METGTRLGGYRIVAALGAGGMGEVWRAVDERLGREVALKLVPAALAEDPARHDRFEREARILASLNHPNIATLYGLEHIDGEHVLVMELVEGEDLSERIARGPLPVDEAVAIAVQIGAALEAAHEAGVVHRDLKPANVKLRPDGAVKVLDFGLAAAWEPAASPAGAAAPAPSHPTRSGVILGTAAYMSPEQARGRSVDRRTDVWALAVVLCEMLSGTNPFRGETVSDTLVAVLTVEPEWPALEELAGPAVVGVIRRCLARDTRERLSSAADVALLLGEALRADARSTFGLPALAARRPLFGLAAAVVLAAGLGAGGTALWRGLAGRAPPAVTRLAVVQPDMVPAAGIAISPDGSRLAFVVDGPGGDVLAVRARDRFGARTLAGTEGASAPFFSPDGEWIGYFTRTELRKVEAGGGTPRTIATFSGRVRFDPWSASSHPTADWGPDGTIVLSSGFWREPAELPGLYTVPAAGGALKPLTRLDGGELGHRWPTFTPDGRHVLFTSLRPGPRNTAVEAVALAGGGRIAVRADASDARLLASGHLVFLDQFFGRLVAAPVDPRTLAGRGPAVPLVEGVSRNASQAYAVAADGTLAYLAAPPGGGESRLVHLRPDGSTTPLAERTASWYQPRVSPDGRHVVVREVDQECRLWLLDLDRGALSPLTSEGDSHQPVWTRAGHDVVYGRDENGEAPRGLFRKGSDGASPASLVLAGSGIGGGGAATVPYPDAFSPGDRELLFERSTLATGSDLWVLDTATGESRPFLDSPAFEGDAAFSPDGRWVAYVSDESGREEVYVRAFPSRAGRQQISVEGGSWPLWSPDGSRLYYARGRRLLSVAFDGSGAEAAAGRPEELLSGLPLGRGAMDVLPDGSGFVLVEPAGRGVVELRLVTGWAGELAALVPRGTPATG